MAEPATPAAGAVLWRGGPSGLQVALVHRPKYDDWTFPKGKLEPGEHVLCGALREVEEETGVPVRLGRRLTAATYLKDGRPKRVDYWTATPLGSADGFTPNREVDQVVWAPVDEAARMLSYKRDADLLREFTGGPLLTRPLVILRHAAAGLKRDWRGGDDALRPLDPTGRVEAVALTDLLGAFGPVRLLSSATARCVETLLPYALRAGVNVTTEQAFTIGSTTAPVARARLTELIADGVPALICTHGEIVADLVAELCRHLGDKCPDDPSLPKSGFWVAHLSIEHKTGPITGIAALERHTLH